MNKKPINKEVTVKDRNFETGSTFKVLTIKKRKSENKNKYRLKLKFK